MRGLIEWFSRNHVAGNLLMAIVLVLGVYQWSTVKKEIFPETSADIVSINVAYPNAAPEEVASGVCVPIEEAIRDIDGIDRVTSVASTSLGLVKAEIDAGFSLQEVMGDIKTRVDAVTNLAENAEEPIIEELLIRTQVLSVGVFAETDEVALRDLAERVREELLGEAEITQVTLAGVKDYELSIEVSELTLREYGLTLEQVAAAVRASSLDLPSGSIRTDAGEILFRTAQRRYTAEEFRDLTVLTGADGRRVTLSELAQIKDGFEEGKVESRFNGKPAIVVNVFRVGDQDTRKVAEAAKRVVQRSENFLPSGVRLEVWNDASSHLESRLGLMIKNGLYGLALVFLVLAVFLRPSLAALVALGIPVSFAGAAMLMPLFGVSVNMISTDGFIMVLGIVVDDAIVVGENVFKRMRRGEHPSLAAPRGTHEVGVIVTFGVLTTAVAFTPMLGLSGPMGKILPNIPLIVIPTLIFSLIQSKLILPAHLALLPKLDPDRKMSRAMHLRRMMSRGLERFVDKVYRPALRVALGHRYVVLSSFVVLLGTSAAIVGGGWVKFHYFPEVEAELISAKLTMGRGAPAATTAEAVKRLEEAIHQLGDRYRSETGEPIVRNVLATLGSQPYQMGFNAVGAPPSGDHVGEVTVELAPADERSVLSSVLTAEWRALVGDIPGVVALSFRTESDVMGNAFDLEIAGHDMPSLEAVSQRLQAQLAKYEWVTDIADNNRAGKRQLNLEGLTPRAEALGLRLADVARQVRQGFYGEEVQRLQRGRHEVKVMVRYPEEERQSLADLREMRIRLPNGSEVPFSEVAVASYGRGYSTVERADGKRMIHLTADIDERHPGANANKVAESLRHELLPQLASEFPDVKVSFLGEQKNQSESLREMSQRFLIALFVMYILMAIPLKSYLQPLIVMSVIPFGLIGALAGHLLLGYSLSIISLTGIVALAGVVVNDGLVLVDYVNRGLAQGHAVIDAVWEAAAARFRPILLTSLTTFAGLTPMLLETDLQAKFLVPMAISLSFGILFATVITLFLVPSLYLVLEDGKRILTGADVVSRREPQNH